MMELGKNWGSVDGGRSGATDGERNEVERGGRDLGLIFLGFVVIVVGSCCDFCCFGFCFSFVVSFCLSFNFSLVLGLNFSILEVEVVVELGVFSRFVFISMV